MSWLTLLFFAFTIVIMLFDPDTLMALCVSPLWFVLLFIFWKVKQKKQQVLKTVDQQA